MRRIVISSALLGIFLTAGVANAASIEWNGFGSAYYGESISDKARNSGLRKGRSEVGRLSRIGLNVASRFDEEFEVAAQFVAGGSGFAGIAESEWDLQTNWAFATYKPTNNFRVKVGRQLFPNWLAAEFIEVGYLQPYRALPSAISFVSPFKNFDGILLDYNFEMEAGSLSVAAWAGTGDREYSVTSEIAPSTATRIEGAVEAKKLYGAGITWSGDGYRVRGQVSQFQTRLLSYSSYTTNTTLPTTYTAQESSPLLMTLGGSYDKNNIVVWAEYGVQRSSNEQQNPKGTLAELEAYYALVGYRIGKWMPKISYTNADFENSGIVGLGGQEQVYNIGFNYDLKPNVIFKFEYEYGVIPELTDTPNDGISIKRDATIAGNDETKSSAIFAGIDFIF